MLLAQVLNQENKRKHFIYIRVHFLIRLISKNKMQ